MPILVRNLPRTLTESQLEALFSPFGDIESCTLVMDQKSGNSKGFGFVELSGEDATQKAIDNLNGSKVQEQKIRVKWSNQEDYQTKQASNLVSAHESATHDNTETNDTSSSVWKTARPRISDTPSDYD